MLRARASSDPLSRSLVLLLLLLRLRLLLRLCLELLGLSLLLGLGLELLLLLWLCENARLSVRRGALSSYSRWLGNCLLLWRPSKADAGATSRRSENP